MLFSDFHSQGCTQQVQVRATVSCWLSSVDDAHSESSSPAVEAVGCQRSQSHIL